MKRLELILLLASLSVHSLCQNLYDIDKILKEYLSKTYVLSNKSRSIDLRELDSLRQDFNNFFEKQYVPVLNSIETEVCKNNNMYCLKTFLNFLDKNNGADEEISLNVLGKMYIEHPDSVLDAVDHLKNSFVMVKSLYFGFSNLADTNMNNYKVLREKLNSKIKIYKNKDDL